MFVLGSGCGKNVMPFLDAEETRTEGQKVVLGVKFDIKFHI